MKDIQPWIKRLKRVQDWVTEKSNNCALVHCSYKNTAENFDHHVTQTLCQNCFRQEHFQRSLALTALAFPAGCVELIAGQFQSWGQKISYRHIHLQNLWGHLGGVSWWVKKRADLGSAQKIQLLILQGQWLALVGVDSLVHIRQKRERGETRSSSVVVRVFCSLLVRARGCRIVFSSAHWKLVSSRFLWTTPAMLPFFFLRSVTSALMLYLSQSVKALSEIIENGLLSGGERRKRSMVDSRMDFIDELS